MIEGGNPFAEVDLRQAIQLRWVMRDIRAKRWVLSPIDHSQLERLIGMGLAEMRDEEPALTRAGHDVLRV
jgi:hypothetical protein